MDKGRHCCHIWSRMTTEEKHCYIIFKESIMENILPQNMHPVFLHYFML